jgi:NADH-quinone oxidoreductase subunit G
MNEATIYIENKPYDVKVDQSLLRACLSLGFDVPYFCWHPAMESVGACRQCAVKLFRDEKDIKGKIIMSCMTQVEQGMRISIDDPEAKNFRTRNIEWLMLNHPHDCPVCDEGGECHLQDMTVMTGHTYRRTRFKKRTYRNQDLGPFINHEMNRCIHCYRCIRFYRDYSGGRDLGIFASHDHVYFGRHENGALENVFSGNLVEICPTGVFTDKTEKRNFIRAWDLQTAPSVCVHCSVGCNTIPGERYGRLQRIRNRYNGRVNRYFLCDRGRFGYEFVNSPKRVRKPLLKHEQGSHKPITRDQALEYLREILSKSKGLIGIGSPRASLEANFALRTLVGPEHFFAGMAQKEFHLTAKVIDVMKKGPARTPSLAEIESCDAVFILGEDITNTAPMMSLAVLQALRNMPIAVAAKLHIPLWNDRAIREEIQHRNGPLFIAASADTWLDSDAAEVFIAAPDDVARLGFAVAHRLDPRSPEIPGLANGVSAYSRSIADALKMAQHPLIISGVSSNNAKIIEAAANVARALCESNSCASLAFVLPECNTLGLGLMSSQGIDDALTAIEDGEADTLIILENDLFRRGDQERIWQCLERCRQVVLLDHMLHETTSWADMVLPAATFAEQSGTLVNNEGRGQRFFQVFVPEGDIRASWKWIQDCMPLAGCSESKSWKNLDDLISSIAGEFPVFKIIPRIAPTAGFRITGRKIPRMSHRASGRTSMHANVDIHEPTPHDDPDSALAYSMEGYEGEPPAPLIPRYWAPGWNSVQALSKFQAEVGGPLHGGDPGMRLIEPDTSLGREYFKGIPESFAPASSFLTIPLYHIFGSEELSVLSPAVAWRTPKPFVALNPLDAERLGINEGVEADIFMAGKSYRLSVAFRPQLPVGTAGIPSGLPGFSGIIGNEQAEIRKVAS